MSNVTVMIEQGADSNHIVLSTPYLFINPYVNPELYNRTKKKYNQYVNTRDEIVEYKHECKSALVELPLISYKIDRKIYLRVYSAIFDSCFVRRLDRFLVNGYFSNSTKLVEKVLSVIAAKELYEKDLRSPSLNWIGDYYINYCKVLKQSEAFSHIKEQLRRSCLETPEERAKYWILPRDFNCKCEFSSVDMEFKPEKIPDLEETSFLSNFGKYFSCQLGSIFYMTKLTEKDYKKIYGDLTADLMLLMSNFNLKTIIWAFVKLINSIIPIFDVYERFIKLLKDVFLHVVKYFQGRSPQPSADPVYLSGLVSTPIIPDTNEAPLQDPVYFDAENESVTTPTLNQEPQLEECSSKDPYAFEELTEEDMKLLQETQFSANNQETWFNHFISNLKMTAPMFAAVMGTIVVLLTTAILGKDVFEGTEGSKFLVTKAQRLGESFATITKVCNGMKSITNILMTLPQRIYQLTFEIFCGQNEEILLRLLDATDIRPPDKVDKKEFFDILEFNLNPLNHITICRSEEHRERLVWCHNVMTEMSRMALTEQRTAVDSRTYGWLVSKVVELRKLMITMLKTPSSHKVRFVPFWVNLIGGSGCGKSTISPLMLDTLKKICSYWPEYEQVPLDDDQWVYHMNFCNKYMVGYTGQHTMYIDDVFQDATPMNDCIPSSLLLIQLVSNIPYTTNQAAIDDKGIEYKSKFILTTSNDKEINRKEIVDRMALIRRMNIRVHVEDSDTPDDVLNAHPHNFPKNVRFRFMTYDGKDTLAITNFTKMMAIIADKYQQWYRLQKKLAETAKATPEFIDKVIETMGKSVICESVDIDLESRTNAKYPARSKTKEYVSADPELKSRLTLFKMKRKLLEDEERKKDGAEPSTSALQPHELENLSGLKECSSYYCMLGLEPYVKNVVTYVNGKVHYMEQFDCDCDIHIGHNQRFREHYNHYAKLESPDVIPSIRAFIRLTSTCDPILTSLRDKVKKAWHFICNVVKTVATHPLTLVVGAVGAIALVYYNTWHVSAHATLRTIKLACTGGIAYNVARSKAPLRPKLKVSKVLANKLAMTEYSTMPEEYRFAIPNKNTYDLACRKIINKDHMVILERIFEDGSRRCNTAVRIVGTCLLTNHHFVQRLKDGDEFSVIFSNRVTGMARKKQIFSKRRYYRIPDTDLGVYYCDNAMPSASSLISHFADKDVPDMVHQGVVVTIFDPKDLISPMLYGNVVAKPQKYFASYGEGNQFNIINTYETNAMVSQGQSGSLLISTESKMMNKILGILVCQNKDNQHGYFKPVSQRQLNLAIETLKAEVLDIPSVLDLEIKELSFVEDTHIPEYYTGESLNYLGKIDRESQVSQQVKTRLQASLVFDRDNAKYAPAVLSNNDSRMDADLIGKSVILRALEGFDHPIGSIDNDVLNNVVEDLSIEYRFNMKLPGDEINKPRLLTDFEMVNGIKPYLNPVDMHTSPGYPYVIQRTTKDIGKFEFFTETVDDENRKIYTMKDMIAERVKLREIKARKGEKVSTIAYSCLKDETRVFEKIKRGKTRIFTCLPMDYNMLIRKYFGSFVIAQHYNAGKIASCVGINQATDWFRLYNKLAEKSPEWEDFDYANWDQHLHPELVMKVATLVNNWYGDTDDSENGKVRQVLLYDLIHTLILVKEKVYVKSSGQCSGCAITAELNCIVHDMLMYYVWRMLFKSKGYTTSLDEFREWVSYIIYGDDIVVSVNPEMYQYFNGTTIKPVLDKLGMTITPGDKTSKDFVLKKPSEITFLKRNFIMDYSKDDGETTTKCLAPLKRDIVDNIMQYIHVSDDAIFATRTNCETALREYFMYGEEEFVIQRSRINDRISEFNKRSLKKIQPITLNYFDLEEDYAKGSFALVGMDNTCLQVKAKQPK